MRATALAVVAVAMLAGCGSDKPSSIPAPATSTSQPAPPAPEPSGDRGPAWHVQNASQSWEAHVQAVSAIGQLLIVQTDLTAGDVDLAVEICRAGHSYVGSIGAPTAVVAVYGTPRVKLAEAKDGPCAVAL